MKDLLYWLRKTGPAAIMADDHRIEVQRNTTLRAWRDIVATIKALDPAKLTCLDAKGNVIRSIVLTAPETEATLEDKPPPPPPPPLPPPISPEMANLQLFARLLAEAWEKAGSAYKPLVDSAMNFVERGGSRLAKAEAEADRLRQIVHKQHLQIAELTSAPTEAEGGDESIMGALVAGVMQGQMQQGKTIPPPTPITAAQQKGVPQK